MIKISDKKDSIIKMKELGLNYFPLDNFEHTDKEGIEDFMNDYPAEEYILRNTKLWQCIKLVRFHLKTKSGETNAKNIK